MPFSIYVRTYVCDVRTYVHVHLHAIAVKVNPKILSVVLNLLDGVTDIHIIIGEN